jgi:type IV fimbrial biogenesis protein FimT
MSTPFAPIALRGARSRRRRVRGFTLVEMLVALCIVAVLLSLAAPSFSRVLGSVHLSMTTNAFLSGLRVARSEAFKRASHVVVCKSVNGTACSDSGGWEQGWIIFHDPNGNGVLDTDETLIQRGETSGGELVLTGNQPVARVISFVGNGGSRTVSGGLLAGTLTLCQRSDGPGPGRQIVIASGGRVRVQQVALPYCH